MNSAFDEKKVRKAMVFLRLFPLLFIVVGVALSLWGWNEYKLGVESPNWPQARARIVFSQERFEDTSIRYEYSVDDITHTSTRSSFGTEQCGINDHRTLAEKFPLGAIVPVFYKPDDPSVSVLVPGPDGGMPLLSFFGAAFVLVGVVFSAITHGAIVKMKRDLADRAASRGSL